MDDKALVLIGLKFKDILYFDQNGLFEIDWANEDINDKGDRFVLLLALDWLLACTWIDDGTIKWETSKYNLLLLVVDVVEGRTIAKRCDVVGNRNASHEESVKSKPNVNKLNTFMLEVSQ